MNVKVKRKTMVFTAILALLMVSVAFSVQPVRAQMMTVNLSQDSGPVGIEVTVKGALENVGARFKVFWDYIKDWDGRSGFLAEGYAEGYNYTATITVPPAGAGEHYVIVEDEKNHATAYAVFTVTPEITVEPDKGSSGINATVSGVLVNNETITIAFYDPTSGNEMDVAQAQTDENGNFTAVFTIPQVLAGDYTVRAYWNGTLQAEAPFTVRYEIAVEPYRAPVGAKIKVSGRVAANESFTLAFSNATWSVDVEVQTDPEGFFEEHIIVPEVFTGNYTIMVYNDWLQVETPFEITPPPSISLDPVEGLPGDEVTVSGSHFAPNSKVTIYFYIEPVEVATSNTNEAGDFTAVFNVPEAAAGTHMVEAVDSTYGVSTTTPFRVHSVVIKPRSTVYIQGDTVSFYMKSTAEFQAGSVITIEIADPVGCPFIVLRIGVADLVNVGGIWTAPYDIVTVPLAIPSDAQAGIWAWNATYYLALYPGEEKKTSGTFNVAERLTIDMVLDRLDELEVKVEGVLSKADDVYLLIQTSKGEVLAKLNDVDAHLTGLIATAKGEVLAEINTAVGTIELRLDELNATITDVKDGVATIQTSLGTVEADLATVKTMVSELDREILSIENGVASIQSSLGSIDARLAVLNAQVSSVKDGVAIIRTEIGDLHASLSTLNATIVSLHGNVAKVNTTLGDVEVSIKDIGLKVESIDGETATIATFLGDLQGKVESINGDIATIIIPSLGTVEANVSEAKNAAAKAEEAAAEAESAAAGLTTTLHVTVILALVAAIVSIANLIQLRKQTAS